MPENTYRPDLMGKSTLVPNDPVEAGSWTSHVLTYTAGKFGIDDQGGVRLQMRTHCDQSKLQVTDPTAPGYLTVEATNGAKLEVAISQRRNIRPWGICVTVVCLRYLAPGDQLIFRIGDTREGGPGIRAQTFCESGLMYKISVDAFATFDHIPLPDEAQATVPIVPGPPALYKVLAPTLRRPDEPFRVILKAEDRWGNATQLPAGNYTMATEGTVAGAQDTYKADGAQFAIFATDLNCDEDGDRWFSFLRDGEVLARSNPLRIMGDKPFAHYWSDLHGQSGETIGTGTAREYFTYARDRAYVDIIGHQGNDFQITDAFWAHLNDLTAEFNVEGEFLAIPGYEWSGNTGMGGDHNVWYRTEGRPIYRSSRALVSDRTAPETDCHDVTDLFEKLQDEDVLVTAHVGGRYADVTHAHDAKVEPSVEVHSAWGSFDWIVRDAFSMNYRVGIVAASDGHKGRPGASYPGDAKFGSYGGMTCHMMTELTRDALFDAFRKRHHYATTGARIYASTKLRTSMPGKVFDADPAVIEGGHTLTDTSIMGDIVATADPTPTFSYHVIGSSPVVKIIVMDGLDELQTVYGFDHDDALGRIRVVIAGQEYRGRGRMVHWTGTIRVSGRTVDRIAAYNFWNPDHQPSINEDGSVAFSGVTTGGFCVVDVWLQDGDPKPGDSIKVDTNHGTLTADLGGVGADSVTAECGGMDKRIEVSRLPDILDQAEVKGRLPVTLPESGDGRYFIKVIQEDGHAAWTSPIYAFRDDG